MEAIFSTLLRMAEGVYPIGIVAVSTLTRMALAHLRRRDRQLPIPHGIAVKKGRKKSVNISISAYADLSNADCVPHYLSIDRNDALFPNRVVHTICN